MARALASGRAAPTAGSASGRKRRARAVGLGLAAVALLAAAVARAVPPTGSALEGVVLYSAGQVLLVGTSEGAIATFLGPATLLEGASSASAIDRGDHISVEATRRAPGLAHADRVTVRPRPVTNGRLPAVAVDVATDPPAGEERPVVVDFRDERSYRSARIPGSVHFGRFPGPSATPCGQRALVLTDADGYGPEALRRYQEVTRAGCAASVLQGGIEEYARSALPLATEPSAVGGPGTEALRVVDVRSREEFELGHLPGAYSVPLDTMTWSSFSSPVGMPPLLFYGADAADTRPGEATRRALGWRYQKHSQVDGPASYLEGGFAAWRAGDRPVEAGPPDKAWSVESTRNVDEVLPEELEALLRPGRGGVLVVDLRNPRLPRPEGALHLPLEDLPARIGELPRDREIVVFCSQGIRSRIAVGILRAHGLRARFTREPGAR